MSDKLHIFANEAEKLHQLGLAVIPCGKEDGKQPLIKWSTFKEKGVSSNALNNWVDQFPDANIGALLGKASGVVVLDDDGNRKPAEIFEEFGPTPLYVKTPSKGGHYYYRFNGEASSNIKSRKLEIKSTGTIVLLPPSVSPKNNKQYQFINDGFSVGFIDDLPSLDPDALRSLSSEKSSEFRGAFQEGERNTALFDYLRSVAFTCSSEEALHETAVIYNSEKMDVPLKKGEVCKTVKSVWGYKTSGNLIPPGTQYSASTKDEILSLTPDELWIYSIFKLNHFGERKEFKVGPDGMANAYEYFTVAKVKKAVKGLVQKGYLKQTHKGGRGVGDTHRYAFILRG